MSIELQISGMTCDACARHVSEPLQRAGARSVDVDRRAGRASVDPADAAAGELARALDATTYRMQRIIEPAAVDGDDGDLAV